MAAMARSVSVRTLRCLSWFPGSPSMLPRGKRTWAQRGARMRCVAPELFDSEMVGIPHASISRWTSPPDWWQTGQTGTTRATSAPAAWSAAAMAGAAPSARSAARVQYPMMLKWTSVRPAMTRAA